MSTYSVRCRHQACRHRRVVRTHPDDYKVVPKCALCGHRKGWRIEGRAYNKRDLCDCGGPIGRDGPIPHNTTHPMCQHHPEGVKNQMLRAGVTIDDVPLEHVGRQMKATDECPF